MDLWFLLSLELNFHRFVTNQVELLGSTQRRTQQELGRAKALDAKRQEEIARLEAQLRHVRNQSCASSLRF